MSNPNPKRSTQGVPLTVQQHDDLHTRDRNDIDSLIVTVNALVAGSGLPVGATLEYCGTTLPTGFLWENGSVFSIATYANLYAAIGTQFNTGGETPGVTARLPKHQDRVAVGCNPIGGVTDGTLTLRTLGSYFGAETSSYTPAGTITTVNGAMTGAPGAGTLASNVTTVNGAMTGSLAVTNGAMTGAPGAGTLASNVTVGTFSGIGTVATAGHTHTVTVPAMGIFYTEAGAINPAAPGSYTTSLATDTINVADVVAAITLTLTNGPIGGAPTAGTLASNVSVALGTLASNVTAVNGAVTGAPTAGTLASNVSGTFEGTPATISILQPAVVKNFIIKY